MLNLVCWQMTLTEHQVHVMRALSRRPDVNLRIVIGIELLDERKKEGWTVPFMKDLDISYLDKDKWWHKGREIISENNDCIHIFNGMWGDRRYIFLILYALLTHVRVALITEPYSDTGDDYTEDRSSFLGSFRKIFRPIIYRIGGIFLGEKIFPVFAISPKAIGQFEKAGFNKAHIYPFGYFIHSEPHFPEANSSKDDILKLVYVGSLIRRKGFDTAISAITRCTEKGIRVSLDLYGPGYNGKIISGGDSPVNYRGTIPFGGTQRVLCRYDLLIVPSRFDGWGVVVNEAIQQGIPVLVSRNAGASAIVKASGAGAIFDPNDARSLVEIIESVVRDRTILERWKKNSLSYRGRLDPENAADYLCQCLLHFVKGTPSPACPWY